MGCRVSSSKFQVSSLRGKKTDPLTLRLRNKAKFERAEGLDCKKISFVPGDDSSPNRTGRESDQNIIGERVSW
jgi:hypothetical protein